MFNIVLYDIGHLTIQRTYFFTMCIYSCLNNENIFPLAFESCKLILFADNQFHPTAGIYCVTLVRNPATSHE